MFCITVRDLSRVDSEKLQSEKSPEKYFFINLTVFVCVRYTQNMNRSMTTGAYFLTTASLR